MFLARPCPEPPWLRGSREGRSRGYATDRQIEGGGGKALDHDIVIDARGPGRLALSGSLTLDTVEAFDDATAPHLAPGAELTLDLSRLRYLDSSGIRAITLAARRLQPDGRLVLVSPIARVMKALRLAGLDQAAGFEVVVDLRSSVGSLSEATRERLVRAIAAHPVVRGRLTRRLPKPLDDPASVPLEDLLAVVEDDSEIRATIDSILGSPDP
jgi:anti-anti-sigma factor